MLNNQPLARDLMTTEVVTVQPSMPLVTLARLLGERGISAVPVTEPSGRLLGIVSEADLLRRLAGTEDVPRGWFASLFRNMDHDADQYARTHGREARDVMTVQLVTASPGDTAAHCAKLMEQHAIKRLPVVGEDGQLEGMVSRADLLGALLEPEALLGDGAAVDDDRIRDALRAEMRGQPWADTFYIYADVAGGVVTLYGFVRSNSLRRGLRVLAGRVAGVRHVEDRMEMMPDMANVPIA